MDQLTSAQLSEWEAYDKLDPIGKWRDEFNFAVLDSLIVNIVSRLYSKKGHTPREVSPTEFMPNWSGEKKIAKRQSVADMKQALMAIAKSVNKKMEGKKPRMTDGRSKPKKPPIKRSKPNQTKK